MASPKAEQNGEPEAQPAPEPEQQPEQQHPERPMPRNVTEAIARIQSELPGVGKESKAAPEQGGYAYRGIEAITAAIQRLMGRYGVVIIPKESAVTIEPIVVNSKPWSDSFIEIEYTAYGPAHGTVRTRRVLVSQGLAGLSQVVEIDELVDDSLPIGPIHTQGRDNSDKGYNKCRTQGYKYALLHTFCIGDSKDDADQGSPEQDAKAAPMSSALQMRAGLMQRALTLLPATREDLRAFCDTSSIPRLPSQMSDEQLEQVTEWLDKLPPEAFSGAKQDAEREGGLSGPPPEPGAGLATPPAGPELPFDVTELQANAPGVTQEDDLRWMTKAPEALVGEVAELVKQIADDEIPARLDALDLPKGGKIEQRRSRLAARLIRQRMEALAGLPLTGAAAPAAEPAAAPEPAPESSQDDSGGAGAPEPAAASDGPTQPGETSD